MSSPTRQNTGTTIKNLAIHGRLDLRGASELQILHVATERFDAYAEAAKLLVFLERTLPVATFDLLSEMVERKAVEHGETA